MTKKVVILSGGLDSTTVLYKLLSEIDTEVVALSFNYGQKASHELDCAKEICELNNVEHHIFDISSILDLLKWSSLIDDDKSNVYDPHDTVVPSRNTILLELATAFAISNDCDAVYYGAIKGDVQDYPDTTPLFVEKINELNKVNNYKYIPIYAPLVDMEKYEVVLEAMKLNVPIDMTWSCYVSTEEPCGECFSCRARIEAIEQAKKILKEE